jgi:hypothetical protein
MKKSGVILAAVAFAFCGRFQPASAQDNLRIWKEFVAALKGGTLTLDRIEPLYGVPKETLMRHLMERKEIADRHGYWQEWDSTEVFPVGNLVHFLVTLSVGGGMKSDCCFSFRKEGDRWFYGHLENIFIRLDKTPAPPTSEFPDVSPETKAWQREEIYWSELVYFYLRVAKEKGKDYFLDLLKKGDGYFVAAKSWVPFLPPQRAFILYLCWDETRLREDRVVLEKLTDDEALVRLQTHFFFLYKRATHLRQWISFDDYRRIFETIWQDRARAAGWKLEIRYEDPECLKCVFYFTKK